MDKHALAFGIALGALAVVLNRLGLLSGLR